MRRSYLRSRGRDEERYLEAVNEARENGWFIRREYSSALDEARGAEPESSALLACSTGPRPRRPLTASQRAQPKSNHPPNRPLTCTPRRKSSRPQARPVPAPCPCPRTLTALLDSHTPPLQLPCYRQPNGAPMLDTPAQTPGTGTGLDKRPKSPKLSPACRTAKCRAFLARRDERAGSTQESRHLDWPRPLQHPHSRLAPFLRAKQGRSFHVGRRGYSLVALVSSVFRNPAPSPNRKSLVLCRTTGH